MLNAENNVSLAPLIAFDRCAARRAGADQSPRPGTGGCARVSADDSLGGFGGDVGVAWVAGVGIDRGLSPGD